MPTKKICPFMSSTEFSNCKEDECAVYDYEEGCCAILSLVACLGRIDDGVFRLKE